MVINCVAAEHGELILKKERNKESSWVKLKAFPTTVGRPNKPPYLVNTARQDVSYCY